LFPRFYHAAIPCNLNKYYWDYSPESAILSAVIFNAIIIPILIPLALKGVDYKPIGVSAYKKTY
jgi:K+-transporting ATPase ATPase B chain